MSERPLQLSACVGDVHANVVDVFINGICYEYRPKTGCAEDCVRKIRQMIIYSKGKTLAWIKSHCECLGKVEIPF